MVDTLLSPLVRGRLELKNRIIFPGHQTMMSEDGLVGPRMRAYYAERARGGAGAVVVEGSAVHDTTKKFPSYLMAHEARIVPSLDELADALHEHGCKAIVQLAHSGSRMPSLDSQRELWAPSDVRSAISPEQPHAVTPDEIEELLDGYAAAAANVASSRCDGIEVHSAHEYLPGEFLSPFNNRRTDEYGGSLENRMRFLLRAIARVREAIGPDRVVGVRINGSDLIDGGLDIDDYVEICRVLAAEAEIDYISVSAGTSSANHMIVPPMDVEEGVYVRYASAIRAVTGDVPVFAVGRIRDPQQAERILADGHADGLAIARSLMADPEWPTKARERPAEIRPCIGCNQGCFGNLYLGRALTCTVNPAMGHERERGLDTLRHAAEPRRVAVVGGGPAGMEAALTAAERGHHVTLFERSPELGGQVPSAAAVDARTMLMELIEFQRAELDRQGVQVRLGVEATVDSLATDGFDHVVVATGSSPTLGGFDGGGLPLLTPAEAAREHGDWSGRHVVVVDGAGHFPAYVPAERLADLGATVTLITARLSAGTGLDQATMVTMYGRLSRKGVSFVAHTVVTRGDGDGLVLRDAFSGVERRITADAVVLAVGNVADDGLLGELRARGVAATAVGDSVAPRTITEAVREGRRVGREL